jgi:drug/metabolite transporter (DMT)-like permease
MTAKSLGTMLALVGALVLISGVVLLTTSRETDDASGSSIAAAWCIVVAGAANVASGLALRRQVWRKRRPRIDR